MSTFGKDQTSPKNVRRNIHKHLFPADVGKICLIFTCKKKHHMILNGALTKSAFQKVPHYGEIQV